MYEDVCYIFTDIHNIRVFDKNLHSAPNCNWLKSYMPTASQSTMMSQSHSILIEDMYNLCNLKTEANIFLRKLKNCSTVNRPLDSLKEQPKEQQLAQYDTSPVLDLLLWLV